MSTDRIEMHLVRALLERPVAYYKQFADITGSVNAAIMLSQALYWSSHTSTERDGWFYKSRDEWEEELGLSRYQQESARKSMRELGFWQEKLQGLPARLWFRVDMVALATLLAENSPSDGRDLSGKSAENSPTNTENTTETTTETVRVYENDEHSPTVPASIIRAFEDNIGLVAPFVVEKMAAWLEEVPELWMMQAIEIATEQNKRSWAYINGILTNAQHANVPPRQHRRAQTNANGKQVSRVEKSMEAVDRVYQRLEEEGIEGWE